MLGRSGRESLLGVGNVSFFLDFCSFGKVMKRDLLTFFFVSRIHQSHLAAFLWRLQYLQAD